MAPRSPLAEEELAREMVDQRRGVLLWVRPQDQRWYRLTCSVDLFGTGILEMRWGGPFKRAGSARTLFLDDLDAREIQQILHRICLRRRAHQYDLLPAIDAASGTGQ